MELELFVAGTSHDHDMVKVACERSVCVMLPGYQALTKVIGKQDGPNYKNLQERGKMSGLKAGEDELASHLSNRQGRGSILLGLPPSSSAAPAAATPAQASTRQEA